MESNKKYCILFFIGKQCQNVRACVALSLNRIAVIVVVVVVVVVLYNVLFWVVMSMVSNNIVVVVVVVVVLRVVHLDISSVNLSNVVVGDRRWGRNRDCDRDLDIFIRRWRLILSATMQSVVVKCVMVYDIMPAAVAHSSWMVGVGDIRKPHRCKVGVQETIIYEIECLVVVCEVFEELILGRL